MPIDCLLLTTHYPSSYARVGRCEPPAWPTQVVMIGTPGPWAVGTWSSSFKCFKRDVSRYLVCSRCFNTKAIVLSVIWVAVSVTSVSTLKNFETNWGNDFVNEKKKLPRYAACKKLNGKSNHGCRYIARGSSSHVGLLEGIVDLQIFVNMATS